MLRQEVDLMIISSPILRSLQTLTPFHFRRNGVIPLPGSNPSSSSRLEGNYSTFITSGAAHSQTQASSRWKGWRWQSNYRQIAVTQHKGYTTQRVGGSEREGGIKRASDGNVSQEQSSNSTAAQDWKLKAGGSRWLRDYRWNSSDRDWCLVGKELGMGQRLRKTADYSRLCNKWHSYGRRAAAHK